MTKRNQPNIVLITTDQQSRHMMSCAGNFYVNTPAMDSLAAEGIRFTRAYCTNPVCVPSRFSLFTGRMPSAIGMRSNSAAHISEIPETIKSSGLGWTLKKGGYDAVFAGKQHLPKMRAEDLGFDVITHDERDELASVTSDFVRQPHEKPYFLVASFINPHDICYMAIREHAEGESQQRIMHHANVELNEIDDALALAGEIPEDEFFDKHCPPTPPNFEPQKEEPEAVRRLLDQRPFRMNARTTWDERKWRMHRWVYARLTERADHQIGRLLKALRESPAWDNTVVIFTSDHGDHDASHRLEHKTVPYEEAAGVPLIIRPPGGKKGQLDSVNLVSNGLDLYPTVCDYAGGETPSCIAGMSLRPLVEGHCLAEQRNVICIESEVGDMICTGQYKYLKCLEGRCAEQLYDLEKDPHETRNMAGDPDMQTVLKTHRQLFAEVVQR